MSTNILDKDYKELQESISKFRSNCYEQLKDKTIVTDENTPSTAPVIPQVKLSVDYVQFEQFATELTALIEEKQPHLGEQFKKVLNLFNTETAKSLFKAAIEMNSSYFEKLSTEYNIQDWVVPFIIENTARPYLQKAANELKEILENIKLPKQCPACGEPPRMAKIGKDGKKNIICPRCYYEWEEKKISCPHCSSDNHEHIVILQVEEDNQGEVYGCKNCNSYTKVLKTADMLAIPAFDILDIKTIHLDYIAQENGYGSAVEKGSNH